MGVPSMQLLAAKPAVVGGVLIEDSFNRTDSTNTLGTTDTGETWTTATGTCGISSNQFYASALTSSEAVATVDSGETDMAVSADVMFAVSGIYVGVLGRFTDNSNYYLAQANTTQNTQLYKKVAGTFTQLGGNGSAVTAGQTLTLDVQGTSIRLLVDGVERIAVTDSALSTGTRAGIRIGGTTSVRADNFEVIA